MTLRWNRFRSQSQFPVIRQSSARRNDDNSGSAHIFVRQADGSWEESQELIPSDAAIGDRFESQSQSPVISNRRRERQ